MTQTFKFNVRGKERKKLVGAISEILNQPHNYHGAPDFGYSIGEFFIDKEGTVTGEYDEALMAGLAEKGFVLQPEDEPTPDSITIEAPLDGFTPESLDNLTKLVESKAVLIKKALGAEELPIQVLEDRVAFPWFKAETDEGCIIAYAQFIAALCATAKEKKRVTARAQEAFENEKFTMRVFCIGLGLIGKEFSAIRKLMMANLSGNSGYRYDSLDRPASPARVRIPAPIINETPEQKAKRELMQLWANTNKRRDFLKSYSEWGIWLTVQELGLTYYRYDLPDGGRILAMEYQRESHYAYSGEEDLQICTTYYLWDGERFIPQSASEYTIIDRLKNLKATLQSELRSEVASPAPVDEPNDEMEATPNDEPITSGNDGDS